MPRAGLGALTVDALAARLGVTTVGAFGVCAWPLGAACHRGGDYRTVGCHRCASTTLSDAPRSYAGTKISLLVRGACRSR
jgi:hypothetical protein